MIKIFSRIQILHSVDVYTEYYTIVESYKNAVLYSKLAFLRVIFVVAGLVEHVAVTECAAPPVLHVSLSICVGIQGIQHM